MSTSFDSTRFGAHSCQYELSGAEKETVVSTAQYSNYLFAIIIFLYFVGCAALYMYECFG